MQDMFIKVAHLQDDIEKIRSKVYRTLKDDNVMLANALHALRKGKTHVTDDHLDRVIESIDKLIKELQ